MTRARVAAGACLAAWLATTSRAGAVEREHEIGLDLGLPLLVVQGSSTNNLSGASLGLHYGYGISDAILLVADAGTSPLFFGTSPLASISQADVGLGYVLDVIRWIPWGAIEGGGYAVTGKQLGGTQVLPGFALAFGLDYRFDRRWSAGIEVKEHMLVTDTSTLPSYTQMLLRAGYTWGW
jgi:hypothetical protein